MSTRAGTYRRISDDREGMELGVNRQAEDLDVHCADRGYVVVAEHSDNDVGAGTRSKKKRPGFDRLLDDARGGRLDVIVAYTSSRLTRRPREFEDLIEVAERHHVRFEFLRSPSFDLNTADGRMIARMLAAADAAESERIGERVARKIEQRAKSGLSHGLAPLGWNPDGSLNVVEAAALREAYATVLTGGSLRGVAARWNSAGMLTRWGNQWVAQTVGDVLRNPRNAGRVVLGGRVLGDVEAQRPPIVDAETFDAACAILSDPTRRTSPGGAVRHLLSGIATCAVHVDGRECGAVVRGAITRNGHAALKCSRARHLERVAGPVEDFIVGLVIERLRRKDAAKLFAGPKAPNLAPLRTRAAGLRAQREALAGDLDVDLDFAKARDRRLLVELEKVESELADLTSTSVLAPFATGEDPAMVWEDLDLDARRAVISELLVIRVGGVGRGHRGAAAIPVNVKHAWRTD